MNYQYLIYLHLILSYISESFANDDVSALVAFFPSDFVLLLEKLNSTFIFIYELYGLRKQQIIFYDIYFMYIFYLYIIYIFYDLSIQL